MKPIRLAIALALSGGIAASNLPAQNSDPAVQPDAAAQAQPPAGGPREGAAARGGRRGAPAPLPHIDPTAEQLAGIRAKLDQLNAALAALKASGADDALIAEAEVSAHYVALTLRFPEEFFNEQVISRCESSLQAGLDRAEEIKAGKPSWVDAKGRVSRAFRSRIDGTPQAYRVIIPASYDKNTPAPLYIYLHGRGDTDLGLGWIGGVNRAPNGETSGGNSGRSYIQLQVFGRANNSFRYAGEADIFEALAAVQKNYNIDPDRIILAGFSMGGAGSWQVGLRHPDMFAGLEIDAGVIGNRVSMDGLTPAQKAAAAPYGIMVDHAVNVLEVPLVGYAGENDAQLAASTSIKEQLVAAGYTVEHPSEFVWKATDIRALFLAIPGKGHSHATGETLDMINAFTGENFQRGRVAPDHIRFVTYTTRYNKNHWIAVDGMLQHFDRAYVDATRDAAKAAFTIKTSNVSRLLLTDAAAAKTVEIDGDALTVKPAASILLARDGAHWKQADLEGAPGLRKRHNLQGPVSDAFLDSFLCVIPSGTAISPVLDQRAKDELARFERMMAKEYRGAAPTKSDADVTPADIAANNLVLFGDPASNKLIASIADKLPIKWTRDSIVVGDKTYSAADHLPVLIYPNPLNPERYVVINTGLVAGGGRGAAGYGDFAVLKASKGADGAVATEIVQDGVFDESWQLAAAR